MFGRGRFSYGLQTSGMGTMLNLWYVNLAVLLIAVPIMVILEKAILAGLIIILYGGMFFYFPIMTVSSMPLRDHLKILGLSNIFGTLLVLGIPMGMYSKFLVEEREISEKLLHNIMPKQIAELLKNSTEPVALENPILAS